MRRWVSECPEETLQQIYKASLLGHLRLSSQSAKRQYWPLTAECPIGKFGTVSSKARSPSYLLCDTLRCFKNRVKVVVLKELCSAELQDIAMDPATQKFTA